MKRIREFGLPPLALPLFLIVLLLAVGVAGAALQSHAQTLRCEIRSVEQTNVAMCDEEANIPLVNRPMGYLSTKAGQLAACEEYLKGVRKIAIVIALILFISVLWARDKRTG